MFNHHHPAIRKDLIDNHPHMSKYQDIKELAESFVDCRVVSTTYRSCVVIAPDEDQADGVQIMCQRNGIKVHKTIKGHLSDSWYIIINY